MRKIVIGLISLCFVVFFSASASAAQTCGGIGEMPCRVEFGEDVPAEPGQDYEIAPDFDLSSLLGFFTDLQGFNVQRSDTWVCEPMTAQIYSTTAVFNFHCQVLDIAEVILHGTFIAFWIILSLFIVMGA